VLPLIMSSETKQPGNRPSYSKCSCSRDVGQMLGDTNSPFADSGRFPYRGLLMCGHEAMGVFIDFMPSTWGGRVSSLP
jgi:hypothetical protein